MLYREADILYREGMFVKFEKKKNEKHVFFAFGEIRGSKSDMPTNKARATSWLKKLVKKKEISESDFRQKTSTEKDEILSSGIKDTFSRYGKSPLK